MIPGGYYNHCYILCHHSKLSNNGYRNLPKIKKIEMYTPMNMANIYSVIVTDA